MLDKLKDGRVRGLIINLSLGKIETPKYSATIIDAPVYRHFIKHTIPGIQIADCAILFVSGAFRENEIGMLNCGTALKHACLAPVVGVKNIFVAVHKLDVHNIGSFVFPNSTRNNEDSTMGHLDAGNRVLNEITIAWGINYSARILGCLNFPQR